MLVPLQSNVLRQKVVRRLKYFFIVHRDVSDDVCERLYYSQMTPTLK